MPEPVSTPDVFDPRRAQRVLALVSVGFFLTALDFTVVNVAFRHIEDTFGPSAKTLLPWTLSGYSIAFAAGLLTAGRMADTFGRKRAFLTGNLVFTTASLDVRSRPQRRTLDRRTRRPGARRRDDRAGCDRARRP